jgi:hypothetical protein
MQLQPLGGIPARCGEDRGETKANGFPKRLSDLALLVKWNEGLPTGPARLLAPLLAWIARRAEASGRAAELLRRYGVADPRPTAPSPSAASQPAIAGRA